MNAVSSNQKFKRILFWFTAIFLAAHILLASLFILFKVDFLPRKLNSFYNKLIILGPFFGDKSITTSPHLYVSTRSGTGDWSPFHDVAKENFVDFLQYPWHYKNLNWSDYERYVARYAGAEIDSLKWIDGSEGGASNKLVRYVTMQQPQADSVKLVYVLNIWQPKNRSIEIDTVFNVMFKPTKGVSSK